MRFYHSLWTKPMRLKDQFHSYKGFATTALYALVGALSLKEMNQKIVLHTDECGEEWLDFIPYDNIHRTLDKNNASTRFWASGKLIALEKEPLGSIHIDTDFIIKNAKPLKKLELKEVDLIIEAEESNSQMYGFITQKIFEHYPNPLWVNSQIYDRVTAYRCGCHRFNNQELKDRYLEAYWHLHNNYTTSGCKTLANDPPFTPDLVAEQNLLWNIVQQRLYSVLELSPQNNALGKGFSHYVGDQKARHLEATLQMLKDKRPEYYHKYNQKEKELQQKYG